jgi:hypothetical protein
MIISRQLRLLPPDIEAAQRFYGRDDLSIRSLLSAEVSTTRLVNLPRDRTLAFFAEGADLETLDLLHLYFPSGTTSTSPYNIPPEREYLLYTVAPDQPGA